MIGAIDQARIDAWARRAVEQAPPMTERGRAALDDVLLRVLVRDAPAPLPKRRTRAA